MPKYCKECNRELNTYTINQFCGSEHRRKYQLDNNILPRECQPLKNYISGLESGKPFKRQELFAIQDYLPKGEFKTRVFQTYYMEKGDYQDVEAWWAYLKRFNIL